MTTEIRMQFDFDTGGLVETPDVIRDRDCTIDTPVKYGGPVESIYGQNVEIMPKIKGRTVTEHDRAHYMEKLLPLETYTKIIVLFSSGKDSLASLLHLLELGVPKEKIELWHHIIDRGSDKKMDHKVTIPYTEAVSKAFGIPLKYSWREGGFWSEVYRRGSTAPVRFEDEEGIQTVEPKAWHRSEELKEMMQQAELEDNLDLLEKCRKELDAIGYRMKFPAKGADLSTRYCSAYLKIMVGSTVIAHSASTKRNCKLLIISGERRGESNNRSRYNEIEKHGMNAEIKNNRTVHVWRSVIDWSLRDVWEKIRRFRINPNPVYAVGFNRCSCAGCLFNQPSHWLAVKELYGSGKDDIFQQFVDAEKELEFTLDHHVDLPTYVRDATSFVDRSNQRALEQVMNGEFRPDEVFVPEGQTWQFPSGAFRGSEGGPC
ncbi:Phosphoadenosine phosphosulfate reductase family protein [Paenibacillus sp. yr247]|uniref:phosphoadenosine phosphosulfate reductase domain-containing protein n=1 Tax=Paenibacillus sp. yr247 TaxID=1761880 RepID=UPI000891DE73|nr:phosphoadenosine phosphosulfate reductase family protein [Paenibacillus sp. yr247]SDO16857.1 Phosphoadenosine phosphosulfate reductase family protein [Paenibacillus sp. yr247]